MEEKGESGEGEVKSEVTDTGGEEANLDPNPKALTLALDRARR